MNFCSMLMPSKLQQSFSWDNVYTYDEVFSNLMEEYPNLPWGIIHQQAWSLMLRESAPNKPFNGNGPYRKPLSQFKKKDDKEVCYRFNKGRCSFGSSCRYDHKCSFCHKTGHPTNNCRKKEKEGKKSKEKLETSD